jgi:hypothetical protein
LENKLKERPILFSGAMVRAVMDGTKTQTRRIVKPQPPQRWSKVAPVKSESAGIIGWDFYNDIDRIDHGYINKPCPYGKIGDRLWVRETFCFVADSQYGEEDWIDYRATPKYSDEAPACWHEEPKGNRELVWKPSIFMPRRASRITLEITGIRIERLQDISEYDAKAEGCIAGYGKIPGSKISTMMTAVDYFRNLWRTINGKKAPWASNPFVWVIEFKRIGNV